MAAAAAQIQSAKPATAGDKAVANSGIKCETKEDTQLNGLVKLVVTPEKAISVRLPSGEDRVIPFDPRSTLSEFASKLRLARFPLVGLSILGSAGGEANQLSPSFIASDQHTLNDVGIRANCRIAATSRRTMPIHVETPSGRTFELAVRANDTIASLKAQIEAQECTPISRQCLSLGQTILKSGPVAGFKTDRHDDTCQPNSNCLQ